MKKTYIFILFSIFIITNSCCKEEPAKTEQEEAILPTITTSTVIDITLTSAICGGEIKYDNGSSIQESGICYSTTQEPTIDDNHTTDGITSVGNFTSNISGLQPATTYYVRAYATTTNGDTGYGNEVQFTTLSDIFTGETVLVDGGTFMMGSPTGVGWSGEHPQHSVTLNSFRISKYEVTNQQFVDFLNSIDDIDPEGNVGSLPYINVGFFTPTFHSDIIYNGINFAVYNGKENYPVVGVTWYGAKAFCEFYGGRLPTEAEWEFAARGGNNSNNYIYSGSDNIDDVAWHSDNSVNPDNPMSDNQGTHPVGQKNPNELGIYDMTGNVFEIVNDWYDEDYYYNSPSVNPQGPSSGTYRVQRGGSWFHSYSSGRVASRFYISPRDDFFTSGFRPVFEQ